MKNSGIKILETARSLPQKILTNDDISQMVETDDAWIKARTGIESRYVCDGENGLSLAIEASAKLIKKATNNGIDKSQIGVVLVATTTSTYAFPSTACMVKEALELEEEVMAFDINAACAGFLYGLEIVRGLLLSGKRKYGIVIGCEQLSKIIDYSDRSTCILFGDGAGAALVELADNEYIHKAWSRGNQELLHCNGVGSESFAIKMEGNQVFKFAVKAIEDAIVTLLQESKKVMDDIDYVICHQANERIIDHVSNKYKGHEHKFYKNIKKYGNTSAASIPIALDELYENGIIKSGMNVICVGFGAGLTWSGVLMSI